GNRGRRKLGSDPDLSVAKGIAGQIPEKRGSDPDFRELGPDPFRKLGSDPDFRDFTDPGFTRRRNWGLTPISLPAARTRRRPLAIAWSTPRRHRPAALRA